MSEESIDFLSSYSSQLNEIKRCMILQKKQVDNSKNDQTKATIGQPDEVLLEVIKSICQSISNHRMHSSVSSEVCLQCPSLYFIIEVLSTLGDRNEFIQQQIIHNFINSHKVDSKMSYVMEDYISDIEQVIFFTLLS